MRPVENNGTIPTVDGAASGNLKLALTLPVQALNGGLFISRGVGAHPERVIDSFEIIFVRDGVLHIQEEERAFRLQRGQSLLLFPGRRHLGTAAYPANLSFYWLHFKLRAAPTCEPLAVNVPQHAFVARPDHLTSLFHRFLDDQETGALTPPEADLLVLQTLLEIARSPSAAPEGSSAGALLASRAEIMLRQHFHENLSASHIARALSCNPDYLGRVFRAFYGHSLTEALLRLRVRHAKKLLLDADLSTEDIASRCGFRDAGYFRRVFKRFEGVTPGSFRRINARRHVITS